MATRAQHRLSDRTRARGIRVAGFAIILLGVGAALLPVDKGISADVIGALLVAAGLIEVVAGSLRTQVRTLAMGAGGVTVLAGLLFVINPETQFFPTVWPIVGWLLLRSLILGYSSTHSRGSVRTCRPPTAVQATGISPLNTQLALSKLWQCCSTMKSPLSHV